MGLLIFLGESIEGIGKDLKIRVHRGGGNNQFLNSLKMNLLSGSSVVGF
jgi:hypothetical protein